MTAAPIYMDNNATTRLDPRVLESMRPYLGEECGNAASTGHAYGWRADEAVENARQQVAALIGARPEEIVFTAGATESDNIALQGMFPRGAAGHLVTAATEHPAVLDVAARLERCGVEVIRLPVDGDGAVQPDAVRAAVRAETRLVSLMLGNNEVGTLHPLEPIAEDLASRGVPLHVDAAQACGHVPVDVVSLPASLLSMSAHKLHGPKGVGALYVRRGGATAGLEPLMSGGGHERGLRPGTVNVPGVVGMGAACEIARLEMQEESARIRRLRDRLYERIRARVDAVRLNGHPSRRLPGNLNLSFPGVDGEALVRALDPIALSTGSACASSDGRPSHVLLAMGRNPRSARSSVRFGLGRFNTREEVDTVARRLAEEVARLRQLSPYHGAGGLDGGTC